MKDVIAWEISRRKKYMIWWAIGISLTIILILSIYPSIRDQFKTFDNLMKQLPSAFINLQTGGANESIASPVGWLNSQLYFVTLPILFLIMSIGLGGSILAMDEKEHTLELILARPISRAKLIASKLISYFLIIAVPWLISSIVTGITSSIIHLPISQFNLFIADIWLLIFILAYGLIAFAATAVSTKIKRIGTIAATLIAFLGYLLTSLANLNHFVADFAKLLPWYYFTPSKLLLGNLNTTLNIYLLTLSLFMIIISFVGFNKRDLA